MLKPRSLAAVPTPGAESRAGHEWQSIPSVSETTSKMRLPLCSTLRELLRWRSLCAIGRRHAALLRYRKWMRRWRRLFPIFCAPLAQRANFHYDKPQSVRADNQPEMVDIRGLKLRRQWNNGRDQSRWFP